MPISAKFSPLCWHIHLGPCLQASCYPCRRLTGRILVRLPWTLVSNNHRYQIRSIPSNRFLGIFGAFTLVLCGVATWDVLSTITFDLSIITRRRPWRWPMASFPVKFTRVEVDDSDQSLSATLLHLPPGYACICFCIRGEFKRHLQNQVSTYDICYEGYATVFLVTLFIEHRFQFQTQLGHADPVLFSSSELGRYGNVIQKSLSGLDSYFSCRLPFGRLV